MTASLNDLYFKEMDIYLDLRDLAPNTRKNYHSSLKAYLTWLSETLAVSPEDATYENIRAYLLHLKQIRNLSNHSINAHASTIRFFRIYILKQGWSQYEVPRMKYRTKLPFVLSKEETLEFIDSIPNLKHKALIVLFYSSGLRISEACSLRYAKEWIPHLKETFKGAANVIEYLGRYTHNIAISNSRIHPEIPHACPS